MKWDTMDKINSLISGYSDAGYWKMRFALYRTDLPKLLRCYYLIRCKRMEAKNGASLGIRLDGGTVFSGKPFLPHGIKGIFITPYAKIGANCTIQQQSTVGERYFGSHVGPRIGDDVFIGVGARVLGDITIGNHAKIGANAVVLCDVPEGYTAVGNPARMIPQKKQSPQ